MFCLFESQPCCRVSSVGYRYWDVPEGSTDLVALQNVSRRPVTPVWASFHVRIGLSEDEPVCLIGQSVCLS